MRKLALVLVFTCSALVPGRESFATQILGGTIFVATTGEVIATYRGHEGASLRNELFLDSPTTALGILFVNHETAEGTAISLGTFPAGTELIFRDHVTGNFSGRTYDDDYFTGPASRNPDGVPHALVDDGFSPTEVLVGFEDICNGCAPGVSPNYRDLIFSLTNVVAVPEPGTLLLLGAGVTALAVGRRRTA